jgi:hypothetical protein
MQRNITRLSLAHTEIPYDAIYTNWHVVYHDRNIFQVHIYGLHKSKYKNDWEIYIP